MQQELTFMGKLPYTSAKQYYGVYLGYPDDDAQAIVCSKIVQN